MKTFYLFVLMCIVLLCTTVTTVSFANSAMVAAADCNCAGNVLKNPSFEDRETFAGWEPSGSWSSNSTYDVCGRQAAVLNGAGKLYQDVQVVPGTVVNFQIWGGYHKKTDQRFRLSFLRGDLTEISGDAVDVDWDVDDAPSSGPILKKYTLNGTAPEGTVYVRVEAVSGKGDWLKVDGACLKITAPPISCGCEGNVLKNASFEDGSTSWEKKGSWNSNTGYAVCDLKAIVLTGSGSLYQDVTVKAGAVVNFSIYGGYHEFKTQTFKLTFYSASNVSLLTKSVLVDWDVDNVPAGQPILKQYFLNGTAPANTSYVRVEATSASGDYFKVDAACLTITPPPCETCTNNILANPSFESGTASWTTLVGTFAASTEYVVCGTKSGKLTGKSTIYQQKEVAPGSTVTFSIYAGFNVNNGQKIILRFLNAAKEQITFKETDITKVFTNGVVGLQKFTVFDKAPLNTQYVSIEIVSGGETFIFDLGCVTVEAGTPLPVKLTDFNVKKEGLVASLIWNTTSETNSKEFEVQHSLNGKQWAILGLVAAEGESNVNKSYTYTHTTPANGNNLYRLRMIDQDDSFAFSRIVSEQFVTEELAVLYPNPSSNFMQLKAGNDKVTNIQIYDVRGIKVRDFVPQDSNAIDVSGLVQGTYIVTFKQSSGLLNKQRIQIVR